MTKFQNPFPRTGEPLPPFALPAILPDGSETILSNENFVGRVLVLFVYPKDATSGCTVEVCGFRDLYDEFQTLDCEIVGLSRDGVSAHRKFIKSLNLPFALLSDKEQTLLQSWNLVSPYTMYGKPVTKVSRDTFVVDKRGIVRHTMPKITPPGHAQDVLTFVRTLK